MPTKTKTPALVPAEVTAAHQSEYNPVLPLAEIHQHPKNLRHDATADPELVGSIEANGLLEPLLVAPNADGGSDGYVLIAGHRRYDGLMKAGHTTAPAIIRMDLTAEADQIAAMLVENGRRRDLTPIEEAEGFDLLTELGWTADRIAETYGCSRTVVSKRRKLTKLAPTHREQIAAGQVTIEDALTLASLPADEQKKLERVAAKPDFHYEIARAKHRAQLRADVDRQIRAIKNAGGTEQKMPRGAHFQYLNDADHGLTPMHKLPTPLRTPETHQGCYGWVETGTTQYPSIEPVCTSLANHHNAIEAHHAEVAAARTADEAAEEELRAAQAAEDEAAREARADAEAARLVAATMRGEFLLELAQGLKVPDALIPALRLATISAVSMVTVSEKVLDGLVGSDLKWGTVAWADSVRVMAPSDLVRTFLAISIAIIEDELEDFATNKTWYRETTTPVLAEYATAVAAATDTGHPLVDADLVARLTGAADG